MNAVDVQASFERLSGRLTDLEDLRDLERLGEAINRLASPVRLAGILAEPQALPPLTDAMILAAAEAHYGRGTVRASGGPDGIVMTACDVEYSFRQMMTRMWPALAGARRSFRRTGEPS